MRHKKFFIIILSIIALGGCISPYYPTITKYEDILVVDGQLTNLAGPYKVKLSRSFMFNEKAGVPVNNAVVKIIDNAGIEVLLTANSNNSGEYSTTDSTFRGVVGKSYKLQIKINELIYESSFETLKKPMPIDKLYWEYKPQTANTPRGIQLFVDTHDPDNNTHYYMWNFEETWRFMMPIPIKKNPEWQFCYKNDLNKTFNINTTIQTHNDIIDRQPLLFINESTDRLSLRYTMLAKQYTVSEQTYKFFSEMVKSNQNQGSLFDQMPYSLVGNISCTTNKDVPVVGYFLVTGASEKRIFIDKKELPVEYKPIKGFEDCTTVMVEVLRNLATYRQDRAVDSLMNYGYEIIETWPSTRFDYIGLTLAKPICFKCTLQGDNKVPSFWVVSS